MLLQSCEQSQGQRRGFVHCMLLLLLPSLATKKSSGWTSAAAEDALLHKCHANVEAVPRLPEVGRTRVGVNFDIDLQIGGGDGEGWGVRVNT
jgi:hypothetical protein